jgi:hypothetical protein
VQEFCGVARKQAVVDCHAEELPQVPPQVRERRVRESGFGFLVEVVLQECAVEE